VVALADPREVRAGGEHAIALMGDGTVRAWGDNEYGLGGGASSEDATIATPVAGLSVASGVAVGEYNSYVIFGASRRLQVEFAGDGAGSVGGRGVVCPPACAQTY
jgi:hypothetical protein